ncbi:MAG: D-alanyl-D-alanine carboxypeptidase, partial [Clostridia bacterium]|nr:D-alanyl-D-alanine carboxypeptidase [Clostridia bacterium]
MKRFLYFLLAALMLLSILPAAALSEPGGTDADPFADISTPHLLLMEAESGRVLYERAADERAFPASTTKLMTALIAVEEISDFDREITLGWREVAGFGANSSLMGLEASETIRLEDVLYGMLLRSGNDAAKTIAMQAAYAHYGEGTDPARAVGLFVNLMNAKAQELGMNSTHFVTVDGRHDPDHYTTAHDFGILMREVIKHQYLIDIMSSPTHTVAPTNKHPGGFYMENSNKLICTKAADTESFLYDKCLCGKTGETNDAGYCLVSCAASRSGRLILVQFGDSNSTMSSTYRYTVAKRMYEWGFDQLSGSAPTDEPTDLPAGEDPFADIATPHILLIETGSGEVLYERGANGQAFPADVTILMTALVAIEEIPDFNEKVTLGWREVAGFTANSTLMGLEAAETIKLEDLLYGMLLCSGADAAKALAMQAAYAHYGEGTSASEAVSRFVDLMNKKARELGMNSTRFVTVDGRHNPEHYTTAHDLGLLMREVIKSQYITDILSVPSRNTEATNMHPNGFHLENTNRLINKKDGDAESFVYDKCLLGKSGATTEAGSCLASCAVSRDVKLILIQLGEEGGSANLYNSAKRIFEWGFQNYRDYQLSEFAPQTEFELRAINASPV